MRKHSAVVLPDPPEWATEWEIAVWRNAHETWARTKPGGLWLRDIPQGTSAWEYERLIACGLDPGFGYAVTFGWTGVTVDGSSAEDFWVDKIENGQAWKQLRADGGRLVFVKPGPRAPRTYLDLGLALAHGLGIPIDSLSDDLIALIGAFDRLAARAKHRARGTAP